MEANKRGVESLKSVLLGATVSGTAGAVTGATVAVLKNAPVQQYTIATGINCGIFGATFFTVRETFLTYQRSKNPHFGLKDSQTRDIDDLISSTMAGVTTGGLLSAVARGPRGVIPGSIMFGMICAGLQVTYTAGNRWRQNKILTSGHLDGPVDKPVKEKKSLWDYIPIPKWSPIRPISSEEYNELLDTKLKSLEEEIRTIEKEIRDKQKK
ncbi:uncharacterized protein BYT42DRAFT_583356 [Radiomyces spectabilis]|uniref:uncharacterized protein n=1 Tax=Radiomyces spectabilis TaxID=64574 RepID=UPI00221E7408|nr:uncharacterized protein BYT42DRAFT_583356 [Radiomyces spectabilis]KAI8370688.1 hypothetical protein BYT42DRAFT_583356 [Radiomyces spectabilis]